MAEPSLKKRFHLGYSPDPNSDCWLWKGGHNEWGYGCIWDGFTASLAHRVSWLLHNGPIPIGMCVLHRCDVRLCVNPDHLWLGTQADNVADMVAKDRQARKLLDTDVVAIRQSVGTCQELGRLHGVSAMTISHVRARQTWAHVHDGRHNT